MVNDTDEPKKFRFKLTIFFPLYNTRFLVHSYINKRIYIFCSISICLFVSDIKYFLLILFTGIIEACAHHKYE